MIRQIVNRLWTQRLGIFHNRMGLPFTLSPRAFSSHSILGTNAREAYLFVYTCTVCGSRSERKISKQAYHHGVVLVKCPGCEKNHLVADNLKWFEDRSVTIEDIMREKGEDVMRGVCRDGEKFASDLVHLEGCVSASNKP